MKLIAVILFFITLCLSIEAKGQSYSFKSYSIAEGLAQTQVKVITEDNNGYLWIGTLGGLSSFNGSTFKNYSSNEGLFNNRITALYSTQNELWIGHQGGISRYKNRKFISWSFGYPHQNISVSGLIYFKNKLIVSTNGNGFYVLENSKLKHIKLRTEDENRIRGLEIINGNLYLATRYGLLYSSDLNSFQKIENKHDLNLTGITKKNKLVLVTNTDGRIYEFFEATKSFKLKLNIHLEEYLNSCIIDSKFNIWSACINGLIYKEPQKKVQLINQKLGLPFNSLNCVYEDKNGTIWIGTDGKGLFRFSGKAFVYFNKNNGIPSNLIISSLEVTKNAFYFGSYDNGLIAYRNSEFKHFSNEKARVWTSIQDGEGNLWIGTDNGLMKNPFKKQGKPHVTNSFGQKITCFYKINSSKIYAGGSGGILLIYKGKVKHITKNYDATLVGTIRNITRFKGKIICAADGGLFEFVEKECVFKRFLKQQTTIYSLKTDENENLWFGGESGLFCSNGQNVKKVYLSDQPASNFINFINYSKGSIFVGTNNGLYILSKLNLKENASKIRYGIEDGLVNLETNVNSSLVDSRGDLWFGTAEGLVCYRVNQQISNPTSNKPFLNISNIKVNFETINYLDYTKKLTKESLPVNLSLPPRKNNLLVELDGVLLKNYKELKYEYWLEGINESWVPSFSSPLINLSNLPSGKFVLHIRAKNEQQVYSNEYKLPLTIKPVFYKTWWFTSISILALGGFIYLFFKIRINREREKRYKQSLEYKTRLLALEQQSLNASMNRHFIFNSLNSIQYFVNTEDKVLANKYLTSFAKLIRKNLDSSSEKNNQVDLSQEIQRLELYLSLEAMRFKDRFDYKIKTNDIDLESIKVPAMLFQPFVENSIIHGILPNTTKKGLITIDLKIENEDGNEKLVVCIEDNGIGIDNSIAKKRVFVGDHKSQGMEITTKRISLLNKLTKRNFELEGPFQFEDENQSIKGTRVSIKIPLKIW